MKPKESSPQDMLSAASGLMGNQPIVAPAAEAAPAADPIPAAQAAPAPSGEAINPAVVVKSPLGDQMYGGNPVEGVVLTSFADVQAFAKDYLDVEIKEVKDLVPVFEELKKAKEVVVNAAETQKQLDTYVSIINNLPKDVSLILAAVMQGQDHMPIIQKLQQKAVMDYNKPFEAHDTLQLVNHYTGTQYTKETFDTLDETAKRALTDSVRLKYTADSNEMRTFEGNVQKAAEKSQQDFLASVESSISNMVKANPNMDKAAVDRVRKIMQYGVADTLFTKEKTYTPDAAERIAMMEFGKQTIVAQAQTIGDIVQRMTNQGVTKELEHTLLKSDKPIPSGGSKGTNPMASIVDRETSFIHAR